VISLLSDDEIPGFSTTLSSGDETCRVGYVTRVNEGPVDDEIELLTFREITH